MNNKFLSSSLRENTLKNIEKKDELAAYFRGNPDAKLAYEATLSRRFPGLPRDYAETSGASLTIIQRNRSQ